ncbi:unnamed protein product [Pleuronectes platessa]|uniref:Uncharacterized protein n=1 Tax=Pleuronectes platessa TaxID=8262 RepID=A0A9N7YLX9_PLEPL|nr:unnamed protein product [Pleuronectes platessa]
MGNNNRRCAAAAAAAAAAEGPTPDSIRLYTTLSKSFIQTPAPRKRDAASRRPLSQLIRKSHARGEEGDISPRTCPGEAPLSGPERSQLSWWRVYARQGAACWTRSQKKKEKRGRFVNSSPPVLLLLLLLLVFPPALSSVSAPLGTKAQPASLSNPSSRPRAGKLPTRT